MKDFTELSQFELDPAAIRLLDESFCRKNDVVVLGPAPAAEGTEPLPVGMLAPADGTLVGQVEGLLQRKVRPVQLTDHEIDQALAFGFGQEGGEARSKGVSPDQLARKVDLAFSRRISFERGQTAAKMVIDLLSEAMRVRATDVHVESYANDVDVRFRIDGVLYQVNTPITPANVSLVVSHVKALSDLNIVERFQSQDGHFPALFTAADGIRQKVSLRVSIIPGPYGEDLVFRFVYSGKVMLGLHELGIAPDLLVRFQGLMHTPGGLFLVTGPTASGKTTTLYAALRAIANRRMKILTVEDPVELEIPKVNQKQVDSRMSFAKYVRAFLRQNPDVILVGEIRDEETAGVALRAAQIGHLVLSTLHTRDAVSALNRISTLGVDSNLLAITLIGVLAQRLVRRICPDCRETYEPDPALLSALPRLPADLTFVRGAGCPACRGTGYYGQTGVFELLDFHDALRRLFARSHGIPSERELELLLPAHMFEDALDKVRQGLTTVEEVFRAVPLPER
ncbi:MAG: type II/IV secretion system protein [Candidatus Riflebacteria bacterium]|nr:type II/IV secretion system protein [Candidatus Riflebacteria bacterium]